MKNNMKGEKDKGREKQLATTGEEDSTSTEEKKQQEG